MRFGISAFVTDRSMRPDELAREVEARGFDSLVVPEHTHIPASRRTPPPMGAPLPAQYLRALDPFVALTAAAMATERLRVGTAVCLVAQRDPIVTAKEVATLDLLSGGRFVFGIGFGWNAEEMAGHGVAYHERRRVAREKVLAMQRLWAQDEAVFKGEYVEFEPSWSWPKPVQRPRPLTLIGGGAGPTLFAHVAEYADGWMPIGGKGVAAALPELRAAMERAGRDPATLEIVPVGSTPDPSKLAYFESIGVSETVFGTPHGPRDVVLPELDRCAEAVELYRR